MREPPPSSPYPVNSATKLRRAPKLARSGAATNRLAAALVLSLLVCSPWQASAATFLVDTTEDIQDNTPGNGSCFGGGNGGFCSLRAAIMEANAWPGADTINLPPGTYTLDIMRHVGADDASHGDLDILGELTLQSTGNSANTTIVVVEIGTIAFNDRVFHIGSGVAATISDVTIRTGEQFDPEGGGIRNDGTLTLNDSVLTDNTAAQGGGIYNTGDATLTNVTVSGNDAVEGGGIYNIGDATLTNVTVSGNDAAEGGGGIFNSNVLSLSNSSVSDNLTGGGIENDGNLTVVGCTISNNTNGDGGGGIDNSGTLVVHSSTISGNTGKFGGGIFDTSTNTIIRNTTISGNAPNGFSLEAGSSSDTVTFNNATVTDNPVGIEIQVGRLVLGNSIVARNVIDCGFSDEFVSDGFNLDEDESCGLSGLGDQSGVDPLLDPLQDNGGPTHTHALQPGSPAINLGSNDPSGSAACEEMDQRGFGRVGRCDVGSFEYQQGVCGDGVVTPDIGEECDLGAANGTPGVCCSATCEFVVAGITCSAGSGDICDVPEVCDGISASCPADVFEPSTTICNPGSGDICDPDESCPGTPGGACPADTVVTAGTTCHAGSGDICDPDESCTGVADAACPADFVEPATTVCNAGSGDPNDSGFVCDPDELCPGVADVACAAGSTQLAPPGTVCNAGTGDVCDPDELCTGVEDQACAADSFDNGTTVCNAGSGDPNGSGFVCDPDELCPGVADVACAAGSTQLAPVGTVCNAGSDDPNGSGFVCDPDELCTGVEDQACAADGFQPATTVCRAVGGICDVEESCPGTSGGACPFDEMTPFGEECGSLDFGDWAEDVELNEGNAYVAVLQDGLQIVRLMATGPEIVGAYDPPSCEDGSGMDELWAEDVELDPSRGLAYLAAGPCGMLIVNVEDPTNPFLEGSFDTLGWTEDVEAMGDGYVLLADFNGGLLVVDIFDPEAPLEVGRIGFIDPSFGGAIDVDVLGSMAYVSTTGGLRIVDVSDPENPTLVGSYDTDPQTGFGEDAEAVEVEFETSVGTFVFLSTWMDGVEIIDVTDPAEPVSVQVIPTTNEETSASLEVTVAGTIAFIADGLNFLRIFDVSNPDVFLTSDPADPIEKPLFQTLGYAWDVEVEDEIAYVAVGIDPFGARTGKLQIVHVLDMGIPLNATSTPIPEPGRDVMLAFGVAMLSALAWRSRWKRGRVD